MSQEQIDLLEVITSKQNSSPEVNTLIKGLLYSPWQCSNKLIDKYVTKSLAKILKQYKQSVLHFVFNKTKFSCYQVYICGINFKLRNSNTDEKADFSAQIDLYKEIISEDLEKNNIDFEKLSVEGQAALVGLYVYATIAIYDLSGITVYHLNNSKQVYLKIKECYLDAYLIRQFRTFCNQHSRISDYLNLYYMTQRIDLYKFKKNSPLLKEITAYLVDKTISININYLNKPLSPIFQQLFDRAQLLTYLSCYLVHRCSTPNKIELKPVVIHNADILKARFNQNEIDNLIADIDNRTGFYNTVLEKTEVNDRLNLKNFNLYYMFNIHAKSLLDKSLRANEKWFEQNYLIPYLRDEPYKKRFIIGKGFQRLNKYKTILPNYDVDVVIYDKKTNLIYFCQLKHKVNSLMTSFRNELKTFSTDIIQHGVKQLTGLAKSINQDLIKQQLVTAFQDTALTKSYIGEIDLIKNSRFILIHNMQDFDFCCCQGVTMYEWNTWRNLLKGYTSITRMQYGNSYSYEKFNELIVDFADLKAVKENISLNDTDDSTFKISKDYLELTIDNYLHVAILNKITKINIKLEYKAPYFN